MVEVQERGLGTFQQDVATFGERTVDEPHGVGDHRGDPWGVDPEVGVADGVDVHREAVVGLGEERVLLVQGDF